MLEAMASGKPVIAVNWGGPSDYLNAECGVLVEPRDPAYLINELERAIVDLASDPVRRIAMGENGRKRVDEHFLWPDKINRFLDVYRTVTGRDMTNDSVNVW